MISGISKVEADYTCRGLDHCGYHKKPNSIIVLVYIVLWEIHKLLCEMQVDFICASKNTRTNGPSGRITQCHSSACAL